MLYRFLLMFALLSMAIASLPSCGNGKTEQNPNVLMTGDPAIDELTKQINEDPNNPILYAKRARLYYKDTAYQQAALNFEKAISLDSFNIGYYQELTDVYLDGGQSSRAINTLERLNFLFPDSTRIALSLGELQMILERYPDAIGTLNKVLEKNKYNPGANYLMGMVYKGMKDTLKALNSFQTAVEENPELIDAHIQLGLLFDLKKNPLAIKYYDNVLRLDSTNFDAIFNKAWYFQQRKQVALADQFYRETIRRHPLRVEPHLNLGKLYLDNNELDKAAAHLKTGIEIEPLCSGCFFNLGVIAEKKGNKEEAMKNYDQAAALDPEFKEAEEAYNRLKK